MCEIAMMCRLSSDLDRLNLTKGIKEQKKSTSYDRFRRLVYTFFLSTLPRENLEERVINSRASVIIDGNCLREVLQPGLKERFIELSMGCRTVICCRVTPYQKVYFIPSVKCECCAGSSPNSFFCGLRRRNELALFNRGLLFR